MKLHQILWYLLILLSPVQLGKHFWFDFSLVNGIRIDYLSPTLYLTDILIIGILVAWLADVILSCHSRESGNLMRSIKLCLYRQLLHGFRLGGRNDKTRRIFIITITIFFLFLNCLLSQSPETALYQLIKIVEFVLLGIYIVQNHFQASHFKLPISIAVIYSSLIAIGQFIKQGSLGGIFYWLGERTFTIGTPGIAKTIIDGQLFLRSYATFPHPNVLAGFLLISLILTFSYWKKRSLRFLIIYLIVSVTAIILTFSRMVWIAGVLVSLSAVILNCHSRDLPAGRQESGNPYKQNYLYRFPIKSGMTIGIILICTIFLFNKSSNIFQEESFTRRVDLNNAAVRMVQQSPIFGVGLNNFIINLSQQPTLSGSTYWLQPVHNIFLLVAAETGLVGLFLFLFFLFQTLSSFRLGSTAESRRVSLLSSFFFLLFLGLFDHYWLTLQQGQLLFTIVLGMSWSKIKT